jgi:hypothetical protein
MERPMVSKLAMTAAAVGTAFVLAAAPAQAQHWHGHHHGGGGFGAGIAGFAAGALIGGAIAGGPYYRGYGPDYGYDYAPEYGYGYAPGPVVVERSGGGGVAYCEQRYRSYDPSSGTFLGYDGMRHPCP